MIPIVAILSQHQQKMASILHSGQNNNGEIEALRREIQELKQLVHQQAIAVDSFVDTQRKLNPPAQPGGPLAPR
jgi:hypothetical protein